MLLIEKKIKNQPGFSLIEAMLSVSIVSIGLIASMQLLTQGFSESLGSRDQSIASGLAQEGIELVRNARDDNWSTADPGGTFSHISISSDCRIDKTYAYPAQINCVAGIPAKRLYIDADGFYVHSNSSATATKFYRKLIISAGATERMVTSMVSWNGAFQSEADCNTKNKCVFVKTTLSDWGA